jgi:HlyD family secretion protein
MDTKLEKKQSKLKIILIVSAIAVAVVLFAVYFLKQKKTYNVRQTKFKFQK